MWAYDSLADREARRAELMKEPGWLAFLDKAMPMLDSMENKVLRPAPFFQPPAAQG
jgi:hypothetical protein